MALWVRLLSCKLRLGFSEKSPPYIVVTRKVSLAQIPPHAMENSINCVAGLFHAIMRPNCAQVFSFSKTTISATLHLLFRLWPGGRVESDGSKRPSVVHRKDREEQSRCSAVDEIKRSTPYIFDCYRVALSIPTRCPLTTYPFRESFVTWWCWRRERCQLEFRLHYLGPI